MKKVSNARLKNWDASTTHNYSVPRRLCNVLHGIGVVTCKIATTKANTDLLSTLAFTTF